VIDLLAAIFLAYNCDLEIDQLLYWQLAYTGNLWLDYRGSYGACFHPPRPQYPPGQSTLHLLFVCALRQCDVLRAGYVTVLLDDLF